MDHKQLIKRAELARNGKSTEAECASLQRELLASIKSVQAELSALAYTGLHGEAGPARAAALATGDPESIIAADRRVIELQATGEILSDRYEQVLRAEQTAKITEAAPKATAAVRGMSKAVSKLEAANKAQAEARADVDRLRSDLLLARRIAEQGGKRDDVDGLDKPLFDKMAAALMPELVTPSTVDPQNVAFVLRHSERELVKGWRPPAPKFKSPTAEAERNMRHLGWGRF